MPRRREVPKREVNPDPVYNDKIVTKFMNVVMLDGKKAVAERIVWATFTRSQRKPSSVTASPSNNSCYRPPVANSSRS